MKIVFAGSSEFAIPALEELYAHKEHSLLLAISQPARPKGRKQLLEDTPLGKAAQSMGIPCYFPEDVNSQQSLDYLSGIKADILVTASYGAYLGKTLRRQYPEAINLHPSLLPLYRGPSPIRAAILAGDKITGNTIFRLAAKMDAGPILLQEQVSIVENEDYSSLHDRLANSMAQLLLKYLEDPSMYPGIAQDESHASYSEMLDKALLHLDFRLSAGEILNRIRAFALQPGAYVSFRAKPLKILSAEQIASPKNVEPGTICAIYPTEGFAIAAGDAWLKIRKVQPAGKKIMDAREYILGARLKTGERIEQ